MKDHSVKEKFIELRARGLSFDNIAKKIKVSKPTLINWCRELELEIFNQKSFKLDLLREKYLVQKEEKIKIFRSMIEKIEGELKERDFKDISTDKLISIHKSLMEKMESEFVVEVLIKKDFLSSFGLEENLEKKRLQ